LSPPNLVLRHPPDLAMSYVVATFYKFVSLPDCDKLQREILASCQQHQIHGSILLAQEGINGTVCGDRTHLDQFLAYLRSDARLADLTTKESKSDRAPFDRLKVKVKPEIVTLGRPDINPSERAGTYVKPQDWNALIQDPEVLVIDTRKSFEVSTGSFAGAIDPQIEYFRDFPSYVDRSLDPKQHTKVAMFCTGGIRCEKASAYMLEAGFENVYHLEGGILKYLEEVPPEESLWEGECFVFDQRVSVTHGVHPGNHVICVACGFPVAPEDLTSPLYQPGISCPTCHDRQTDVQKRRNLERTRQRLQARTEAQKTQAIENPNP
jgi:UPF0176 protein